MAAGLFSGIGRWLFGRLGAGVLTPPSNPWTVDWTWEVPTPTVWHWEVPAPPAWHWEVPAPAAWTWEALTSVGQ